MRFIPPALPDLSTDSSLTFSRPLGRASQSHLRLWVTLALAAMGAVSAIAQVSQITWANSATDFNTGASWTGGGAPGSGNSAVFSSAGTPVQPNLTADISILAVSFTTTGWTLSGSGGTLTLLSTTSAAQSALRSGISGGGTSTVNANVILAGGSTAYFQAVASNTLVINGVISSTSSVALTMTNPGNFTLNGANTYTGTTNWNNASTIATLGNKSALGSSTLSLTVSNTIKAGADLTGSNKVMNAITFSGSATPVFKNDLGYNLELGGTVNLGGAARTLVSHTGQTIFSGVISNDGGGGLTISASNGGSVVLSGANTYTGATTVSAGTLLVNGSTAASSAVTVASGGTLGGSGTVNGATSVSSGGTLAPGNSPGLLTFGSNLTLASGSNSVFEINGTTRGTTFDAVNVAGLTTYGGTFTLTFGSTIADGNSLNLLALTGGSAGGLNYVTATGSYTGNFSNSSGVWTLTSGSQSLTFTESTGNLAFAASAIPEPSTYAALAGLAVLALSPPPRRLK